MARKPTPPRVIPNFAMDKPWTEPASQQEQEALASSATIYGTAATDRAITLSMQQFAGDATAVAQALQKAQA